MGRVIRVVPGSGNGLQDALDRASPGDTVVLGAGEHFHRATIRHGGRPGAPITIEGEPGAVLVGAPLLDPPDLFRMGVDDLPSLATWAFLRILRCGHVVLRKVAMRSCWPTGIYAEDAWDLAFEGCVVEGGSYPFFVRDTRAKTPCARGIAVRGCSWVQDTRIWKQIEWKRVHHGDHFHLNGALLGTSDVLGDIEFSGNQVRDAFNALRIDITGHLRDTFPEEVARRNRNIFVFDNLFERIRDNVLEPETWAYNMHFHRNRVVDCFAPISLDGVGGGYWYFYGNVFRFETRPGLPAHRGNRSGKIVKLAGYPLHPANRWYFLNNSIHCRAAIFGDGDSFGVPIWNLVAHDNVIAAGDPLRVEDDVVCPPAINAFDIDFRLHGDTGFGGTVTNVSSWCRALVAAGQVEGDAVLLPGSTRVFVDAPAGNLALEPGSPARGSGRALDVRLPGGEVFEWAPGLHRGAVQDDPNVLPTIPMRSV